MEFSKTKKVKYIEFIGTPGSGKTTIARGVIEGASSKGFSFFTNRSLKRKKAHKHRGLKVFIHIIIHPVLTLEILFFSALKLHGQALDFFKLCITTHLDMRKEGTLVYDQGITNFLLTSYARADISIQDAIKLFMFIHEIGIEVPDQIVFIDVSIDASLGRVRHRKSWHQLKGLDDEQAAHFLSRYANGVSRLQRLSDEFGFNILRLDGTRPVKENTDIVIDRMRDRNLMNYRKYKMIFFTTSYKMAGAEKMILHLVTNLDKDIYDPMVVVIKAESGGLKESLDSAGIRHISLGLKNKFQIFKVFKLLSIIRKERPDILQSFLFFDNLVASIVGRICRVPVIIGGIRNVETDRSWLRNLLEKTTSRFRDLTVSNSEKGKKYYIKEGYFKSNEVTVIPNGIDIKKLHKLQKDFINKESSRVFDIEVPLDVQSFCYLGRLTKQKGISVLIEALCILRKEGICPHLFILGDGELRTHIEELIETKGLGDQVHLIGFKEKAVQYLPIFDGLILPSLWEGMPNVILEAMASRVPVISTDVGGVREILGEESIKLISKVNDPKDLVEKIKTFTTLSDNDLDLLKDNAYSRVEKMFTIEAMVTKFDSLYKRLLC